MKRTAKMQVLDEYAKKLTKKQMTMLYEQKMSKKYTKKIYEAEDDYVEYTLYLDSYIISDEMGMTQEEVVNEIRAAFGYDLKISEADTGINFTTSDSSVYENLLAYLEELGVEPATIADITDQAYLNDVEY